MNVHGPSWFHLIQHEFFGYAKFGSLISATKRERRRMKGDRDFATRNRLERVCVVLAPELHRANGLA
jgi:hypothetical protein